MEKPKYLQKYERVKGTLISQKHSWSDIAAAFAFEVAAAAASTLIVGVVTNVVSWGYDKITKKGKEGKK